MRQDLVERARSIFARAGYYLSAETNLRPASFDFLARRDDDLVVVKVLTNVDSLGDGVSHELRALAEALGASPLVVGERSSSRPLEAGALYTRHGVPILALGTLEEWLLEGMAPLAYAAPGGFYVNLDGARLRALRTERGVSLGQLAEVAGVSRRAIAMYEEGMGAMVEVAERLERFLDEPLVQPVDPRSFRPPEAASPAALEGVEDDFARETLTILAALGFRVVPLARTPMNAVSLGGEERVLTGVPPSNPEEAQRRARAVASFSLVAETLGAILVERRTTRVAIEGTPVLAREELLRIEDPAKLVALLRERQGKRR